MDELERRVDAIATDHQSGALDLAGAAVAVLLEALAAGRAVEAARQLCRAQPAMAPVWNAALHAVASRDDPGRFADYARRIARSPAALVRVAVSYLASGSLDRPTPDPARADAPGEPPLRLVTFSASGSVQRVLEALATERVIRVALSEARPGGEGHRLAAQLAARGIAVTFFTDAGIGHALDDADAVLLGADAIGPAAFINKTGSRLVTASANLAHVPVYVAATRDKLAMPALWPRLRAPDAPAGEVWDGAPPGISVRNPYFEPVPFELVSAVLTDLGALAPDMVAQACIALEDERMTAALRELA